MGIEASAYFTQEILSSNSQENIDVYTYINLSRTLKLYFTLNPKEKKHTYI